MMRVKRNNGTERILTIQTFRRKYSRDRNSDIRRLLSGTLIVALLLGQMELSDIFAQTGAVMQIAAFAQLSGEISSQTVYVGTPLEELSLPETLEVVILGEEETEKPDTEGETEKSGTENEKVDENSDMGQDNSEFGNDAEQGGESESGGETEPGSGSASGCESESDEGIVDMPEMQEQQPEYVTIEPVTWQSEPEYDGNVAGVYVFSAVLPELYVPVAGVSLPQITVTVREEQESSVTALLTRPYDEENSSDMVYYLADSYDSYSWEIWTGEEWEEISEYEPELTVSKEEWYTCQVRCM